MSTYHIKKSIVWLKTLTYYIIMFRRWNHSYDHATKHAHTNAQNIRCIRTCTRSHWQIHTYAHNNVTLTRYLRKSFFVVLRKSKKTASPLVLSRVNRATLRLCTTRTLAPITFFSDFFRGDGYYHCCFPWPLTGNMRKCHLRKYRVSVTISSSTYTYTYTNT